MGLVARYAHAAAGFVKAAAASGTPFFLYVPFSHLHQLCPPSSGQWASLAFANRSGAGQCLSWCTLHLPMPRMSFNGTKAPKPDHPPGWLYRSNVSSQYNVTHCWERRRPQAR